MMARCIAYQARHARLNGDKHQPLIFHNYVLSRMSCLELGARYSRDPPLLSSPIEWTEVTILAKAIYIDNWLIMYA